MNTIIEFPTPPATSVMRRADGWWLVFADETASTKTTIWLGADAPGRRALTDLWDIIGDALATTGDTMRSAS